MSLLDVIKREVNSSRVRSQMNRINVSGGGIAVFIAGPIDEDYDPKVNNHHWEVATLAPVVVIGLSIDLGCCDVIDSDIKVVQGDECHTWLSLDTDGKEHTAGVLLVIGGLAPNLMQPLAANALSGGGYLPVAVTFIGRHENSGFENVITQWHEELLKFYIPLFGPTP